MTSRTQRLEALPVTSKHRKLLFGAGIGWALDAMDVGLISFVMAALSLHLGFDKIQLSWLATAGFIGMALGATLGGLLADRIGRKQVFALTMLVYGVATGASALVAGIGLLILLRFIVGLGLGAELPVASTLMAEFAPRAVRGRMIVLLEAFWALGWILAAIIGTFVVANGENGWRWGLALGMIPAIYSLVIRRKIPESVAFLETKGKHDEAEKVVAAFEAVATVEAAVKTAQRQTETAMSSATGTETESLAVVAAESTLANKARSIWSPTLRHRTVALWIIWFCINLSYYGAFIWIPTLLVQSGFDLVKSFSFTLIITLAQLPGYATAAWLIEKIGRRLTLTLFLIGSAIGAGCYAAANTEMLIIVAGCVLSFFNLGAWGALYAIGPDLYPTQLRGRGTGAAAGFGRIASILAPLLVPVVLQIGGIAGLFVLFATAFMIAAVAAWILPEQRGVRLS